MKIEVIVKRQYKYTPFHQMVCHKTNPEKGEKK